jgi:hypothetical protein
MIRKERKEKNNKREKDRKEERRGGKEENVSKKRRKDENKLSHDKRVHDTFRAMAMLSLIVGTNNLNKSCIHLYFYHIIFKIQMLSALVFFPLQIICMTAT